MRGGKSQDYPQQFPAYMYGGWTEPNRGFYGPPGYGSIPFMFRGHPGMEIIPTSGVDYMTDQFQGSCMQQSIGHNYYTSFYVTALPRRDTCVVVTLHMSFMHHF